MFSKYFPAKYFAFKYFDKGSFNPIYTNSGDIQTTCTKDYSVSGDIKTIVGNNVIVMSENFGDIWTTVLKAPIQTRVSFGFDIETELT